VATFDDFVVVERLVEFFHFRGEFAGVYGAYPVVLVVVKMKGRILYILLQLL